MPKLKVEIQVAKNIQFAEDLMLTDPDMRVVWLP